MRTRYLLGPLFAILAGGVSPIAGTAGAQRSPGAVSGVVRDSLGVGISAALVAIEGLRSPALTDSEGRFRLIRVPAGEHAVEARRLGFSPETVAVSVAPGQEARLDVQLDPLPAQLPAVRVSARPEVYDGRLAGFNARRRQGGAGAGYFITRERLDAVHSYRFIDIMREVPGVRVGMLRGRSTVRFRGASCDPLVFIDGFPAAAGAVDLGMIDLGLVEGIEVYSGLASVPPEFVSVRGGERCGVVAVWSRPFRARPRAESRRRTADIEQLVARREVYTADEVGSPAALAPGTASPVYPDSLWRAGVGGRVLVELIVDTSGVVEPGTVRVVSATHPSFAGAVRAVLEAATFRAAEREGRRVRQLVQLPFVFSPGEAGAAGSPPGVEGDTSGAPALGGVASAGTPREPRQ